MNKLYDLKEMLCNELEELSDKADMSMSDLEKVHLLTASIKNIDKICMYDDGYSYDGDWRASGTYDRHSNAYRKRDAMGRYSRHEGTDMVVDEMRTLMKSGDYSAQDRAAIEKAIKIMDR